MIKIINDKEKLININPLVIYFVLSAKEYKEYREDILNLQPGIINCRLRAQYDWTRATRLLL